MRYDLLHSECKLLNCSHPSIIGVSSVASFTSSSSLACGIFSSGFLIPLLSNSGKGIHEWDGQKNKQNIMPSLYDHAKH